MSKKKAIELNGQLCPEQFQQDDCPENADLLTCAECVEKYGKMPAIPDNCETCSDYPVSCAGDIDNCLKLCRTNPLPVRPARDNKMSKITTEQLAEWREMAENQIKWHEGEAGVTASKKAFAAIPKLVDEIDRLQAIVGRVKSVTLLLILPPSRLLRPHLRNGGLVIESQHTPLPTIRL